MNKKEYKEVFSKIQPSDNFEERIMFMTSRKKFVSYKRALITALAVISLICSIGIFANAATDGAVSEAISQVAQKVTVLINGKKTEQEIVIEEIVGKDGEINYKGEVLITEPDGEEAAKVEFEMDSEGAAIGMQGSYSADINAIIADEFELYIPTTAEDK
ncbi:MAG: hypothetical protein IJO73_02560 [Clostridia bacterium]|nr:hypothetical protein [Clostridia bacterium]